MYMSNMTPEQQLVAEAAAALHRYGYAVSKLGDAVDVPDALVANR